MKANWLPLSAAVALALGSVAASAVDFHGYARAGMQANRLGGNVYCLGTGEKGHKVGRLGDECDTYVELAFSQEVYNKASNKWTINALVAYGTYEAADDYEDAPIDLQGNSWQGTGGTQNRANTWSNPWGGERTSLREIYAKYDTSHGFSVWAGKRYYQRKDVHILDLIYLNNDGYGAGIESIGLGNLGNLNFAVMKSVIDSSIDRNTWEPKTEIPLNRNTYKFDLRWNGIPLGPVGNLDASLIYGIPLISDQARDLKVGAKDEIRATRANSGALATLDLTTAVNGDNVGLMNKFVVQYGTNGFASVGQFKNHGAEAYSPDVDIQGLRFIDWGTLDVGNFGLGYSFLWGHINVGDDHANGGWVYDRSGWEYSIVLRPEYKWTEFTRTTLELGYSKMKSTSWVAATDDNPDAYKITLAQQFTPGKGFWTRPAIRFYVSYLGGKQLTHGNVYYSATDGNWVAGKAFKDANEGHNYQVTIGTQVEAWW